jgi:cytochrome P450
MLLLQDAAGIRHVLKGRPDNYTKNFGTLQDFFGASRFTTDGKQWEDLQRLSQPSISSARPDQVARSADAAFSDVCLQMLGAETTIVPVDQLLNRAAARVISEVAFGISGINVDTLVETFREILRFGVTRTWNVGGSNVMPTEQARDRFAVARRSLIEQINTIVRQTEMAGGSELVRRISDGDNAGVDVVAEISSLLFAGFDTTAAAIGWGMFLLAASPELQGELRRKVRAVAGAGPITTDVLYALPELWAFQQEVMRIFPPVPLMGRTAVDDDEFEGVTLGSGNVVILSLVGLHHDPKFFPGPAFVRLNRYDAGRLDKSTQSHHLPFSSGRRACAGSGIASIELGTALAVILSRVKIDLADSSPLAFEWTASLRRQGGHRFRVTPA